MKPTSEPGTLGQRLDLGPSTLELFRIFRMPAVTTLLGLAFLILGLVAGTNGHNLAIILGAATLALTALLVGMELRDLEKPWVAWDALGLTLGRRGKTPLTLTWEDISDVRLHESVGGRRRTPGRSWIFLEVRPLRWRSIERTTDITYYQDPSMTPDAIGVPASAGDSWLARLDEALRAAHMPAYTGVTVTQEPDPRAVWRRPKTAQTILQSEQFRRRGPF